MAITKIHAIQATVHKAITYICNPDKTDGNTLISSYCCSPETAAYDFKFSLSKTKQSDPNKAFHLIQSFMPGEVSYEEAHTVGVELADRLLEGKYSYIVSTHIDMGHVHNHIIFCAADNVNYEKYHDCKQSYYHIRRLNDDLCKEHQLSVLPPTNSRGKKYKEWLSDKQGDAWKTKLKIHIDEAIKQSESYDETNRIYHIRYQKSKDKDRYLRQHETELLLHDGAENMLKRFGVNLKALDVEKLRSDYNALYSKKQVLQKTYKSAERENADLGRKLDNLSQYLDRAPKQQTVDRKSDKNTQSL